MGRCDLCGKKFKRRDYEGMNEPVITRTGEKCHYDCLKARDCPVTDTSTWWVPGGVGKCHHCGLWRDDGHVCSANAMEAYNG